MSDSETFDNRKDFSAFGKHFQEAVMVCLLTDKKFAEQLVEVFDVSYFELKYLQFLASRYFAYAKKYRDFPSLQLLVTIIRDELRVSSDVVIRDQIVDFLRRSRSEFDPADLPFVKDRSLTFCKKQALKAALEKCVDLMSTEKYETIVDVVKTAVSVGQASSLGHDLFEDIEARFVSSKRECVPTGIPQFDQHKVLGGGAGGGELGCIIGGTGAGKCVRGDTYIHVHYKGIKINGRLYRPWDRIKTRRGDIFVRDVSESDELIE